MNSKVYVNSYASLIEYKLGKNLIPTLHLSESDVVVNPYFSSLIDKTIIINLPIEVPIDRLMQFNKIISRFPIGYGIEIKEYNLQETRVSIDKTDYSCLILSKEIISDVNNAEMIDTTNFLIGIDETIDESPSLIGYLLTRTKVEDLS